MQARSTLATLILILSGSSYPFAAAQALEVAAPAPADAAAVFQVVRVGDGQMACGSLAAEINQLTADAAAADLAAQGRAADTARAGMVAAENRATLKRVAFGGLVHASGFIPFGGGFAALAARSAAMSAAGAAAAGPQIVQVQTSVAPLATTPQAERRTHLEAIFQHKGC